MPNRPKSARASMRRLRRSPAMLKPTPTRASVHEQIDDRHPSNRYQLEHPGSMLERISVRASMFGDARTDGIGSSIHVSSRCPLENRCPAMLKMTSARASMFQMMSFRASFETDRLGARADMVSSIAGPVDARATDTRSNNRCARADIGSRLDGRVMMRFKQDGIVSPPHRSCSKRQRKIDVTSDGAAR